MMPEQLPTVGVIFPSDSNFLLKIKEFAPMTGKNVLAIGFNEEEIVCQIDSQRAASIRCLTLWNDHIDAEISQFPLVIGDITKRTRFDDGEFDAVVSLSLFEHVDDLEGAVAEMRRITRKGGRVCAMFGPVWSSAYGHHLYVNDQDPLLNFSMWRLPAHMHLLSSDEEVIDFYVKNGYARDMGEYVVKQMHHAPHINRRMFEDYISIFANSFEIEWMELMTNSVPDKQLSILREKYHPYRDFSTYGATVVMRVPS